MTKFESLIELVSTNFTEVQSSVQELLQLKDDLFLHFLPPPLLFRIAIVFGNVYRSFSDLNTPVYEMLRLVKIFSASWEKNSQLLKKMADLYENKKQLLNISIKRLANVDKKTKLFAKEKRIMNWEKLFIKLNETKGHGKRWKFRMETFRKKSNEGYNELLNWVLKEHSDEEKEEPQPILNKRKSVKKDRERRRKSKDISKEKKKREIEYEEFDFEKADLNGSQLSLNTRSQLSDDENRKNDSVCYFNSN